MSPRINPIHPAGRPAPAPPGIGAPHLEATVVLDEVPPPDGFVLWRLLQDVALWVKTPPAERPSLFYRDLSCLRALPPVFGLEITVPAIHTQLRADPPDAGEVSRGCEEVSEWAQERRCFGTAVVFAQAAADAVPTRAALAHRVGMLARLKGDRTRAEVWYRRAIVLARRSQDWHTYALGYEGLGLVCRQRGSLPAALRFHQRSLRAARNYRVRQVEGKALHNLCGLSFEMGRPEDGLRYARAAFHAFGPGHPALPLLAHDLAYFWMEAGAFGRALRVFQQLLRYIRDPLDRLWALANLARAAGGVQEREMFESARMAVWELAGRMPAGHGHAAALVELARGAASLGLADRAEEAATRAVMLAELYAEHQARFAAESVLAAIRAGGVPGASPAPAAYEAPLEDELARDLIVALARSRG